MAGRAQAGERGSDVYCLVPAALASKLERSLRRRFRDEPWVEVLVDRRAGERRSGSERRVGTPDPRLLPVERRRVRSEQGRRIGERRASLVEVSPSPAAARLGGCAEQLLFVRRVAPEAQALEDAEAGRMVVRFQSGEQAALRELYLLYFDRVYSYLRLMLADPDEAEDVAQDVFVQVLKVLERYELRAVPFRAWLFRVARNCAINRLSKLAAVEVEDPVSIDRRQEAASLAAPDEAQLGAFLSVVSNDDLLVLVRRLPPSQRQAIALRYMLGFTNREIAGIMGHRPDHVRQMQHRGLEFLRVRLAAAGRRRSRRSSSPMLLALRQAPVLRARRFAMTARGEPFGGKSSVTFPQRRLFFR